MKSRCKYALRNADSHVEMIHGLTTNLSQLLLQLPTLFFFLPEVGTACFILNFGGNIFSVHDFGQLVDGLHLQQLFLLQLLLQFLEFIIVRIGLVVFLIEVYNIITF